MTWQEKGIGEFVAHRYWQCEGKTLIACNFLSSVFFSSYETLFNIENLPDICGNFDFKFCLGTRNFSLVDLRFCFWIVSFQFSLNIVNSSLISYSNDSTTVILSKKKRSMANNNV